MKDEVKKTSYSILCLCQLLPACCSSPRIWLFLVGVIILASPRIARAQDLSSELKVEHRVVSIQENAGLVPATVIVKRGTTVIWLNYSSEPNVIKFQNKKVTTACRSPINFYLADNGSYQSKPLTIGAVASLCFIEKGTFEYKIRPPNPQWNDPQLLLGTIRVY
jgi:plastocyanin